MPEGDTVHRAAGRIHAAMAGQRLTRTDFRVPRFATTDLEGRVVEGARAVGKHLFVDVGSPGAAAGSETSAVIHSHLKMEGKWFVHDAGTRWTFPGFLARVVLRSDGGVEAVGVELGEVNVFTPAEASARVEHIGPDLLGEAEPGAPFRVGAWSGDEALRRFRRHGDRAIGAAILDQRLVAGIGNEYRSELLFLRGIDPTRTVREVDARGGLEPLIMLARRTMAINVRRQIRIFTGVDKRRARHWVYGRGDEPCRRCGTAVIAGELGTMTGETGDADRFDRTVFYCPSCQR